MDNRTEEYLAGKAYVRNFIEDELRVRDQVVEEEPEVSFTVRLPASSVGDLENVATYLGSKRTPFASALLREAIEDAVWALVQAEDNNGRGRQVRAYLNRPVELEGGGHVQSGRFRGEV